MPTDRASENQIAETVLRTIQQSLKLSVGTTRYLDFESGRLLWLVNARSADGSESWTAKGEDYYEAVCALAELVGFDLRDG